ncbi:hypothetical protein RRG08_039208 [Elysia crispata]|uniref:Uncharacterized protein n=1 Tax=Elysia crispata TaxID=231223 RepID=A0AAE1ASX8_9GAST|nr:hypothetical protein RRG08_039208 [Elysia crispata]
MPKTRKRRSTWRYVEDVGPERGIQTARFSATNPGKNERGLQVWVYSTDRRHLLLKLPQANQKGYSLELVISPNHRSGF